MLTALLVTALTFCQAFENPCADGFIPFPRAEKGIYECDSNIDAYNSAMQYLEYNLPSFDVPNKVTLGFNEDQADAVDGLDFGVANYGTNLSLSVRTQYKWAADVEKDIYNEYVLPYANVNEGRSNWRELLLSAVQEIFSAYTVEEQDKWTVSDVVSIVNANLWSNNTVLGKSIVFKSSQTPLIYDSMSTLAFGYASCTGVSIFFVNALRSVGVPARVAGTPAWNNDASHGNHNWVEVYLANENSDGGVWSFIEAAPAGGGETLANPCDKWFCNPSNFANGTEVYAVRFNQRSLVRYPMAWDLTNIAIPGDNMSRQYQSQCNSC